MCGILGIVALAGRAPSLDDAGVARLRDLMTHRGPDSAGLWRHENAVLAHRRLSVVDLSAAGAQPMATPDARFIITYNGELYNDAEIRRELQARGIPVGGWRSRCDAETILHAFATWGTAALSRFRGMYAFAIYDTRKRLLTLARDPLGVKPLYLWSGDHEIVFASEIPPILAHPAVSAKPNLEMVSAYLTTIRTVLGNDTLFSGVHALRPGQMAQCDLGGTAPTIRFSDFWSGPAAASPESSEQDPTRAVRAAIEDSVAAHLLSDVPVCAMLSGGLDSTIIATIAARHLGELRTYCAGAVTSAGGDDSQDDLSFARLAAQAIGSSHAEAVVTRELFAERWAWMVAKMGVPLSTPNEVAIYEVAAHLRADSCIVALSGEGADELFAGYEPPMISALRFTRGETSPGLSGGAFQLESNAWIPPSAKGAIFSDQVCAALAGDAWLHAYYDEEFERCEQEVGLASGNALDAHLRFHRRTNLTGLLQRLDTATMLASVEGRTPFADAVVAELAESLPMSAKFAADDASLHPHDSGATATLTRARTKIALRDAFRTDLPPQIVERPKASFPLPFQEWAATHAPALRRSEFARAIFSPAAIETIAAEPVRCWRLAWPMINIALWGERWW